MQFLKNPGLRSISLSIRLRILYDTEQTLHTKWVMSVMQVYMSNPNPFLHHRHSRQDKRLSFRDANSPVKLKSYLKEKLSHRNLLHQVHIINPHKKNKQVTTQVLQKLEKWHLHKQVTVTETIGQTQCFRTEYLVNASSLSSFISII